MRQTRNTMLTFAIAVIGVSGASCQCRAALAVLSPRDGAVVPLQTDCQKAFLAMSEAECVDRYTNAAFRAELRKDGGWQRKVELRWSGADDGATVELSLNGVPVLSTNVVGGSLFVDNLEIARRYDWLVRSGHGCVRATFSTEDAAPRFLSWRGVPNVRDLGGRIGLGGRRIRQSRIYRSAGLNNNATAKCYSLEELKAFHAAGKLFDMWKDQVESNDCARLIRHIEKGDVDEKRHVAQRFPKPNGRHAGRSRLDAETRRYLVSTLGIRTDVDLRGRNECWGMTGSPIGPEVAWCHVSSCAYGALFSQNGREAFAKVFRVFLDERNYPIVFHCIGGRDRTWAVAYVLNALLGVGEDELRRDWEATCFSDKDLNFRHKLYYALTSGLEKKHPAPTVRERAELFVKSLGFSDADIRRFRSMMFE